MTAPNKHHEPAVAHAQRIPGVADEAEHAGQVERDGGHQPEDGDLVCLQVQLVLEKEADGDVDQASDRRAEGQQHDQHAEVEEDPLPRGLRQGGRERGDARRCRRRTVRRHCAQGSSVSTPTLPAYLLLQPAWARLRTAAAEACIRAAALATLRPRMAGRSSLRYDPSSGTCRRSPCVGCCFCWLRSARSDGGAPPRWPRRAWRWSSATAPTRAPRRSPTRSTMRATWRPP